ncbi:MAG: cytidine deaminase [Candidatus Nanohaloarchaea archaeon]|nr:cytidine deaminase [Candidatus Nanohaloarchaea archaeon]
MSITDNSPVTEKKDRSSLPDRHVKLLQAAEEVTDNAYQPYDDFVVGAAVLTSSGNIIKGVNVGNAAFHPSNCAERNALQTMETRGQREVEALAVIGHPPDAEDSDPVPPCGQCRQVMIEVVQRQGHDFPIYLPELEDGSLANTVLVSSAEKLLPLGFGPDDTGKDVSHYLEE